MNAAARFHDLYRHHAEHVYRFAYWLSGDADLARDIVSDTFARIWVSAPEVRVETARAYLLAIARNLFLHHQRRRKRQAPLEGIDPAVDSPDAGIEARSELDHVLSCIQRLPEGERTALLLHGTEGLSYAETARVLGKSEGAVRVLVHRARRKLARIVQPTEDSPS